MWQCCRSFGVIYCLHLHGRSVHGQSQCHLTTGGLPPISSSWRQTPWDSRKFFFLLVNWTVAVIVTSGWVCLLWIGFTSPLSSVRIAHIAYYCKFFLLHYACKSSVIMPILRIICYNGSLVNWTVVRLTAAEFKPLIFIFSMIGFILPYTATGWVWWARFCVYEYIGLYR
jgi:hypothetical protein